MFKETQIWERFGLHCALLHCMQWHSVRHWIVFIPKIKNLRSVYDLITCYCDHFFADVPWQTNTTSTSFAHLNNLTHPYPQCIEYQKWITQAGIVLFWHFFSEKKHLFVDAIDGDYRGQPWQYIGIGPWFRCHLVMPMVTFLFVFVEILISWVGQTTRGQGSSIQMTSG